MSVYKRGKYYYYMFSLNGKSYRKSTGQQTLKEAERVEQEIMASLTRDKAALAVLNAATADVDSSWADQIKAELAQSKGGQIGLMCRRAKSRAAEMNRPYILDYDAVGSILIACGGRCTVTGMPLSFTGKTYERPSIDRIDSKKGYTLENIRITSVIANLAMNTWGEDALRYMCGHYTNKLFFSVV